MGKFIDKQRLLLNQMDLLRATLNRKTGNNLDKASLQHCINMINLLPDANIEDSKPDDTIIENGRYKRPDWYLNFEDILNAAPIISISSVTYYPHALFVIDGINDIDYFCFNSYSTMGQALYADMLVFSDEIDNESLNITSSVLHSISPMYTKTWDKQKDITDGTNSIRFIILYTKYKNTIYNQYNNSFKVRTLPVLEAIFRDLTVTNNAYTIGFRVTDHNQAYATVKYINFLDNCNLPHIANIDCGVGLIEVHLPNSCVKFGSTSGSLLYRCSPTLRCINFDKINTLLISDCIYLNLVDIIDFTNITDMQVTGTNVTIYAQNAKQLILPDNLNTYYNFLCYNEHIKSIVMPATVTSVAAKAFMNNYALETIYWSPNITSYNGANLFSGCTNIKRITLPTIEQTSLDCNSMCYDCNSLEELIFPDNIETLENIYYLLYSKNNMPLRKKLFVHLPNNIKTITRGQTYGTCLTEATFIEMPYNFDVSGVLFHSSSTEHVCYKELNWFKHFTERLKDKSADSVSGTAIVSNYGINILKALYLTYDAETKSIIDWVSSDTENAISAFDYITTVKNWTLS